MAHVVVIGAGLGGLPTAYELRHFLPAKHTVTLISDRPQFTFIPGLIRVALGLASLDSIQLELRSLTQLRGIQFIEGRVVQLDPHHQQIIMADQQVIDYDYAAIATGASLDFSQVPGLGPHSGFSQSVCTPDHALQAHAAWQEFLKDPGPLVVGAAPGAGCFGPAYEFLLMAEWILRCKGLRDQVPITYITPEPYVGHLGISDVKNAQKLTTRLMERRGIEIINNAAIQQVDSDQVTLANGRQLPMRYSMILPAFQGVDFVRQQAGLGNSKGFIPVTETFRHPKFHSIYALGVSVALEQPEKTVVPISLPKSGEMTEAMGVAVAHNIAVELEAIRSPLQTPTLEALCFAEFGETGIAYIAAPVLPDPNTGKRRYSYAVQGAWVNGVKAAFEWYFLIKMRMGLGLPWFENLGLKLLFGLSLLKPIEGSSDPPNRVRQDRGSGSFLQ